MARPRPSMRSPRCPGTPIERTAARAETRDTSTWVRAGGSGKAAADSLAAAEADVAAAYHAGLSRAVDPTPADAPSERLVAGDRHGELGDP